MSTKRFLLRLLSFYPPYLGAGVRVRRLPHGFESRLVMSWFNRNYFGTHFGGSLYTMCDPFFTLILAQRLGPGYLVWDKVATIRFRRPGRGTVTARFEIPPAEVEAIRRQAERGAPVEPVFTAEVRDAAGEVVAEVETRLWVRKR